MIKDCKTEVDPKQPECPTAPDTCNSTSPLPTVDWRKTESPFKNEKSNKYSVTITLKNEVKTIDEVDEKVVKPEALLAMLDFYGKDEENVKMINPDDLEIEKLYVDPRLKVLPKVLVTISTDTFDEIPDILAEEEEEGSESADDTSADEESAAEADIPPDQAPIGNFVIFKASEIKEMFTSVAKNLEDISEEAVRAAYSSPDDVATINFSREASRLLGFKSDLLLFIGKNDFTLDELEKIKLKFDGEGLFSVEVGPKASCSKELTKGLLNFKKKPDVSRELTVSLVSRLPDIYKDFNSRRSLNYTSFMGKYLPGVASTAKNGYFDRAAAADILPFRKYVSEKYKKAVFKTKSEVDLEFELMTDATEMRDRYENLFYEEFPIGDELAVNLPQLIKESGNYEDMVPLWVEIINGMGMRGMMSLARVALNKASENLNVDVDESIISTSFIMNLNNSDLVRFINKIPTQAELQDEINAHAEDILVGLGINEYDIPWKEGATEESFSSFDRNPNSPLYDKESLSNFEEKFKLGTIANQYRQRIEGEIYNAYRKAISETMSPSDILAIAEINFEGPSIRDALCLRALPNTDLNVDLQLPKFNGKIGIPQIPPIKIPDLLGILIDEAIKALLKLILNAIMLIIEKILSALGDGVCETPSNFGIEDLPVSDLRTIIKNSIPIQGNSPELIDSFLTNFLSSSGYLTNNSPETRQMVSEFVGDISVTLTENELMLLLKGEPTKEVLILVSELSKMRNNFLSQTLADPNNVADLFSSLSNFIPPNFLETPVVPDLVSPTSIGVCRSEGALERFSGLRCSLLAQNKGLEEAECKKHLEILKDLAKNDVEDLNNIIQNFDNMIGCSIPSILSEPSCPDDDPSEALLPQIPDSLKEVLNSSMSSYFDTLELSVMEDLIDHQGFLDMVLADKLGAGFKQHANLINGPFGNEDATQLGPLGLFASAGSGRGDSFLLKEASDSFANFPDKVAGNLERQLKNLQGPTSPNYETVTADGFTTFIYEYPRDTDDYSFLLSDTNITGREYVLKLKEVLGVEFSFDPKEDLLGKEFSGFLLKGLEDLDASLENYLESDLSVNLESPEAKMDCLTNTIVGAWSTAEGFNTSIKSFSEQLFFYFHKKYLSNISKKITDKDSSGHNLFDFGYDSGSAPTKVCLDPEEFGGTEDNPPFYLEPPERYGWLDIYDKMIPELDGEEPRRDSIIKFDEISEKIIENSEIFPDDERIYVNTRDMFIPPFYQILDKSSKAMMEAVIRATIRVYIFDTMIKGVNVFGNFKADFTENFDDVLASYITENIVNGLLEEGKTFFGKKDDSYYLDFLEQTVQSFGNLVDAGLAEPTAEEQIAIDYLNREQSKSSEVCKATRAENKIIRLEFLRKEEIQDFAKVIFRRYIKEELKKVSESFEEKLEFDSVLVDHLFVQDENWINGNIEITDSALRDVQDVVKDIGLSSNTDPNSMSIYDYYQDASGFDDDFDYTPFVLERYIKIEDYSEQEAENKSIPKEITERNSNLFEVVNVDSWQDFLDSISNITSDKKITDFWKSWKFGLRISMIPTSGEFEGYTFEEMASTVSDQECKNQKAFRVSDENVPLFPFISHEEVIEDTNISDYENDQVVTAFNKKQACLLSDFFDSPQYKSIFKYSLSFSRILSMVGIYTINGFLPSLRPGEKMAFLGFKRGLLSWDRQTLKKSKNQARIMFEAVYHSQEPGYIDRKRRRSTEFFRENNKIKSSSVDIALKWWERKLQLPRPFDKDGNPKEYEKKGNCPE